MVGDRAASPAAFLSYTRFDDQQDEDRISYLKQKLAAEVRTVSAVPFEIFQDRHDIRVGQQWRDRIEQALDSTTLLIAFLTPSFFASEYCRDELKQFLEREKRLQRNDLIFPVLYVPVPALRDTRTSGDWLIEQMKARQTADWTMLRFLELESADVRRAVNSLANQIEAVMAPLREQALRQAAETSAAVPASQAEAHTEQTTQSGQTAQPTGMVTSPTVRIVDGLRGPHLTVSDAVRAARPGDRIIIRPGTYDGGIVLDKPLELLGEGQPNEIVIEATGANALAFRATLGRVANLSFKQRGGGDYFAIDISQGRLTLEGCYIESASLAGVAVHGAETAPIVRNNRIRRCGQSGVVVFDGATGWLEENEIVGNGAFGVLVRGGSTPVLRSNEIRDNEYGGIQFDGGSGRLEDNEISANRAEGVLVANEAAPVLQRNRIFKNAKAGIYVYDRGAPVVRQNQIFDNQNSGIAIRAGGNPIVQENSVSGNNGKGVWCDDQAAGVVENNTLSSNKFGAFWKSNDSTTRYVGNRE